MHHRGRRGVRRDDEGFDVEPANELAARDSHIIAVQSFFSIKISNVLITIIISRELDCSASQDRRVYTGSGDVRSGPFAAIRRRYRRSVVGIPFAEVVTGGGIYEEGYVARIGDLVVGILNITNRSALDHLPD